MRKNQKHIPSSSQNAPCFLVSAFDRGLINSTAGSPPSAASPAALAAAARAPSILPAAAISPPLSGAGGGAGAADADVDVDMTDVGAAPTPTPATPSTPASASASVAAPPSDKKKSTKKKKKKKARCGVCRSKLGLTGFKCRCDNMYCDKHRYADDHSCTFDYVSMHKEQLTKDNPVVVAAKLEKL